MKRQKHTNAISLAVVSFLVFCLLLGFILNSHAFAVTYKVNCDADTYVDSSDPNSNFGGSNWTKVGRYQGGVALYWTYLKFKINDLISNYDPSIYQIDNAKLYIQCFDTPNDGGFTIMARGLNEAWDENTITWITKPTNVYNIGHQTYFDSTGWVVIDITATVERWFRNPAGYPNYGLTLFGSPVPTGDSVGQFYSKEFSTSTDPYISVILQPPHTVSTPNTPSGPSSGATNTSYTYSTGGASCTQGHGVHYRYYWGDGTNSNWSSSTIGSNQWTSTGTYTVKAQARCSLYPSITSSVSSGKTVTITNVSAAVTSVVISGPIQVNESSTAQYSLTANYDDGTSSNVTSSASWSENSGYASISASGLLTTSAVNSNQSCAINASYGGRSDTHSVTIKNVTAAVTSVVISGPIQVNESSTAQYSLTANYDDGTSSNVTSSASWSENSGYASIGSNGLLTTYAVSSNQSCAINASYGGRSDTHSVTIKNVTAAVTSVIISGSTQVNESSTAQYTLIAYYSNGTSSIVTNSASWSENTGYASISSNGLLTTNSVSSNQSCTITASYGGKSDTHSVTIKNVTAAVTSVIISGSTQVNESSMAQYTLIAYYSNGTSSIVTNSASWSENSGYASIGSNGLLTTYAVSSNQSCTITASYGGKSDTHSMTINDVPIITSVAISGPTQVNESSTVQYTLWVYYSNDLGFDLTSSASWSENCAYADISASGLLTTSAVSSNQSCTITASYGGKSDNHSVTIKTGLTVINEFVTRFYQLCLGRNPDSAGLEDWVNALLIGSLTGSDVAYGFVFSEEFLNINTTNEEYLQVLYEAFFNRPPDAGGKQGWLDAIANGASREEVLNGFIYAQEFTNLCDDYGIWAFDQDVPVMDFVTRFYQLCLDRDPDAAGLEGWTNDLLNQVRTGADVAIGFIFSQEFINKNTTNEQYLTILYKAFFDRDPDQAGWDVWIAQLNSGRDRGYVLDGFLYSQEFINLCEDYGIDPY